MIYFETSAKSGFNVERAFFKLTEDMSERDFSEVEGHDDNSYFDPQNNQEEGGCC
jgi:hypothetical protein